VLTDLVGPHPQVYAGQKAGERCARVHVVATVSRLHNVRLEIVPFAAKLLEFPQTASY
jgi:hypothetical protein